jgi:spermidine synthase
MLKKILSFLYPITIHRRASALSRTLEVTWNDGELILDSQNTNYSYGSLQRILRKGLAHIGTETVRKMEHILVLGVAGGSVIRTLRSEMKYAGTITGVEIDPEVIAVANAYFGLHELENVDIVIDDAFEFVLRTRDQYDLIIIDIFQDTLMPAFLFEGFFAFRLSQLLRPEGVILFNTMLLSGEDNRRNASYPALWPTGYTVSTIPRVEQHNELFIIRKD